MLFAGLSGVIVKNLASLELGKLPLQKQSPEVSYKKGVLKNIKIFIRKHFCQSLFSNKVASLRPAALLKKRPRTMCFLVNFRKFKNTFFSRTPLGDCF